jgi:adenylate kinase
MNVHDFDPTSVIVVVGPPNAGKGTQSSMLAEHLQAVHFSTGDLLRAENRPDIMDPVNGGALAPSEYIRALIKRAIDEVPRDQVIVLDGAKKLAEAQWLLEYLPTIGRHVDHVISLQITEDESRRRSAMRASTHGRADDAEHVQDVRWERYKEDVTQTLDFYRDKGLLLEVDAVGEPQQVTARVMAALGLS